MIPTWIILQAMAAVPIMAPVELTPESVQVSPTAAARAISVEGLQEMPAPTTVTLQCIVSTRGNLENCIPADDGGTTDPSIYFQRLYASLDRERTDPILAAAVSRMIYYNIRTDSDPKKSKISVIVREIISPTDRAPRTPPLGTIPRDGVKLISESSLNMARLYPSAAIRRDAEAQVNAICTILDDFSLFCRNPEVYAVDAANETPSQRQPEFDKAFGDATLRLLASMRAEALTNAGQDSLGRELPVSINWRLH